MMALIRAIVLTLALSGAALAGPLEDGIAAWDQGDWARAVRLWTPLAEQGDARAQHNLGTSYYKGQGVPQDYAEAAKWYQRAAEQGTAEAQTNLGISYANGQGVPQDYAEAAKWYRRAAEQGNALAQNNLGTLYGIGHGVPQDYAEAAKWYRRAAEQGASVAQHILGLMYGNGQGVPQDFVKAYMWLTLAAPRDSRSAEWRDRAGREMTPAQIAEAQRLAREWRPASAEAQPPAIASLPPRRPDAPQRGPSQLVREAQALLARLGYQPGPQDGMMGGGTRSAVQAYQNARGLTADGEISEALVALMREDVTKQASARPKAEQPPKLSSTGTGFFVSRDGHVLTNAHVVDGCREIRVKLPSSGVAPAAMVAATKRDDLALVKVGGSAGDPARFRTGEPPRLGDSVVVFGFPLSATLSSSGNLTTGAISALAGLADDPTKYQITAPVQPGNSGGPLLDASGNVVGVVVSKLNAIRAARITGNIPQNVNFAIKATLALSFLEAHGIRPAIDASRANLTPADIGASARKFTVAVECLK